MDLKSETWALLLAVFVLLFIGGLCGFFIRGCNDKPLTVIKEIHDTTYLPAKPILDNQAHVYPTNQVIPLQKDTANQAKPCIFSEFTFADSIRGSQDSIKYKVTHTSTFTKDSVISVFGVEIQPFYKIVTDSIWIPQIVLQNEPWHKDGWAYSTIGLFIISVLYLIGIL
jgi:hypothetical protein